MKDDRIVQFINIAIISKIVFATISILMLLGFLMEYFMLGEFHKYSFTFVLISAIASVIATVVEKELSEELEE